MIDQDRKTRDVFKAELENVWEAYISATQKHPVFADSYVQAVSLITEELGELAKEVNDMSRDADTWDAKKEYLSKAYTEASHVAVTALRTMTMLRREIEK